ncbi:MAG: helix-turn-helix transcriptional regulator [Pyrinomonadaceae bacterium]|nr:helix-turn-helix transcriptional regulator [Pyrinomonadaceae bacterium]
MRRREGDGCPITGLLQVIGDKWTLLIVRDLARMGRRTTELLESLHPISSRTLLDRLRDMERDLLIERRSYGGSPPHVEYLLTERGRLLVPLLDLLRKLGDTLGCNNCADRKSSLGSYCQSCLLSTPAATTTVQTPRRTTDDSIVLL